MNIFIMAEVDKDSAFLGEQITLSYKLYKDIDTKISGVDQFQMPDFNEFELKNCLHLRDYNTKIKK